MDALVWIVLVVVLGFNGDVTTMQSEQAFKNKESCEELKSKVELTIKKDKTIMAYGINCSSVPVKVNFNS